jgi:hypothetical protein
MSAPASRATRSDGEHSRRSILYAAVQLATVSVRLRTSEPTLEDVFVELVGRGFADDTDGPDGNDDVDRAGSGRGGGESLGPPTYASADGAEEAHPLQAGR